MIAGKPTGRLCFVRTDGSGAIVMDEVNEISAEMDELSADESMGMNLALKTASTTFNIELDKPLPPVDLARLMGMPVVVVPRFFACTSRYFVPVKTHRKKRIRKKWLKRYGMRLVFSEEEKEPFIYFDGEYTLFVGAGTWEKIREGFSDHAVKRFNLWTYYMATEEGKDEKVKTD